MKRITLLCLAFISVFVVGCTTNNTNITNNNNGMQVATGMTVESIINKVDTINASLSNMKKEEKPANFESSEGGQQICYQTGDVYRKVVATYLGEFGKTEDIFYFDDEGSLIYIESHEYTYNAPIYDDSFDDSLTEDIVEKYYFDNESILKAIGGEEMSDDVKNDKELYWIKYSRELCR